MQIKITARRTWARAALAAHVKARGDSGDTAAIDATDLIADLLHLVCRDGDQADDILRQAKDHYLYELMDATTECLELAP